MNCPRKNFRASLYFEWGSFYFKRKKWPKKSKPMKPKMNPKMKKKMMMVQMPKKGKMSC